MRYYVRPGISGPVYENEVPKCEVKQFAVVSSLALARLLSSAKPGDIISDDTANAVYVIGNRGDYSVFDTVLHARLWYLRTYHSMRVRLVNKENVPHNVSSVSAVRISRKRKKEQNKEIKPVYDLIEDITTNSAPIDQIVKQLKQDEIVNRKPKTIYSKDVAIAYCDGSYDPHHNAIGAGLVYIGDKCRKGKIEKGWRTATSKLKNVKGELEAAAAAASIAACQNVDKLIIYYDYVGVRDYIANPPKKNKEICEYSRKMKKHIDKFEIEFVKVTSHSGNSLNDKADRLARDAIGVK